MTIKVGIIGAGAIANNHCNTISSYPGAEVVAVADLSAKRRNELKKKWNIAKAFASWEDIVSDQEIDAVTIALPNSLHAPCAIAALRSGKHVLLDKPFAMNHAEAKRCADAAKQSRKVLMVGMNQRYSRQAQTLRALAARGEFGEIYHAKAYWCRRSGSPKFGTWFVNKKLSGGGCMLDIGVHYMDLCMYVSDLWKPVSVSGQTYSKFGPRGIGEGGWGKSDANKKIRFDVDDSACALIKCRNGATIELNISWVRHQKNGDLQNVELYGTEAGASLSPLEIYRFGKKKGEYEVVQPQGVSLPDLRDNRHHDWLDMISRKRKAICTLEQALTVQKVLDAIYKSSATGREVRIR